MLYEELSSIIISKSIEIHKSLGPGLLESAYREFLSFELKSAGLLIEKEKPLPIVYKDVKLDHGYRLDLLVENKIVVELKVVDALSEVHFSQILTYMKIGGFPVGLLLNFHVSWMKDGIKRFILQSRN